MLQTSKRDKFHHKSKLCKSTPIIVRSFSVANPTIQEQLEAVSILLQDKRELRNPLELHRRILRIQLRIDKALKQGATSSWNDQGAIINLQKKSNETKKPIASFLDPAIFNLKAMSKVAKEIVEVFSEHSVADNGQERVLGYFSAEKENLAKLLEATLKEDISSIEKVAEELSIKPSFLLYITSTLIQPFLQEVARKIDVSQLDSWWQSTCPVCGRQPAVAKIRQRKRYLACTFCGTEYLSDRFVCVNCGNKDPYTLRYLAVDADPALQIDFCDKCRHYIKVIDELKLGEPIPKGLEDIMTLNLDILAERRKLTRDKPL